jgi:hypothetical protein
MPNYSDELLNLSKASLPLPGRIVYDTKQSGIYATYVADAFRKGGKLHLKQHYLGKVIDQERGIFKNSTWSCAHPDQ